MTNLTEQWKKGELPEGMYYFKLPNGETMAGTDYCLATYLLTRDSNRCEVLAEVPSYEEWQKHRKTLLKTQEKNCDLEIINTKLKELLKECYSINEMVIHTFNWLETIVTPSQKHICPKVVGGINRTQQSIKQALGEE